MKTEEETREIIRFCGQNIILSFTVLKTVGIILIIFVGGVGRVEGRKKFCTIHSDDVM